METFPPPEGHCSLHLLSENVEDDTGSYRKLLYFGGARRTEESSWKVASSLFEITYFCEADDVTITDITQCDTIGSRFSCLQSAAACVIQKKVLVWGGLNTERIDTTDEFFLLKKTRESGKKYQCTLVQTNVGNESGHVQKGDVPNGRSGHTLNKLSDEKLLLFGGLSMQTRNVVGLASPFSQVCNDGSFYILEISSLTWIKLTNVPDIQPRTYHTPTSCILAGNLCVAFIGGIIVSNNCPSERICVDECILLKAVDISNNHFSLDKIKFEMTKPIYISYHSSIVIKTSL